MTLDGRGDGRAEGIVEALDRQGDAVVTLGDGRRARVRGVLPGERVRVARVEGRRGVGRGIDVEILAPSSERISPPCPLVDRCGGCALMHASATAQSEFKRQRVVRALESARLHPPVVTLTPPASRLAYRARARLAFGPSRSGTAVGYREAFGASLVDTAECCVLSPTLTQLLTLVRARVAPLLSGAGEVRLGSADGVGTLAIDTPDTQSPALYALLEQLAREGAVRGASLRAGGASVPARFGLPHERTHDVDGRTLELPLGGFSQAHAEHNHALAAAVLELAAVEGKRVLELFAGHGNFTLALAARAESVVAVELDAEAVRCLAANLARHGLEARAVSSDAAPHVRSQKPRTADVVVLDPPRGGASDVVRALPGLSPERIVYVSCDPETLASDLFLLAEAGYTLEAVQAFDMFPQTAHVEVVVRLDGGARRGAVAGARARR